MLSRLIAVSLAVSAGVSAASCPIVTSTSSGLTLTIKTQFSVTNGRPLAGRLNEYDPSFGLPINATQYASVDVTSPTILGNLRDGVLHNQTRSADGTAVDLPPAAYINLEEAVETTNYYLVAFANSTLQPLDDGWYLEDTGNGRTYDLHHNATAGLKSGWLLCLADWDLNYGPWYALEFYTYNGTMEVDSLHAAPTCDYASVQAELKAVDQTC